MGRRTLCLGGALLGSACAHLEPAEVQGGAAEKRTQAELQQDVQRFSGLLTASITESLEPLIASGDPRISDPALRLALAYSAAALDIATEPTPELALLDMVVFVVLARTVIEEHYAPLLFGEAGRSLAQALLTLEEEVWRLAALYLGETQRRELATLIEAWHQEHPEQVRIESVRLLDLSFVAGEAARQRSERATSLVSGLKSATVIADQAVLLGERALFLTNRLPFLLRMQARLGAREVLGDTLPERAELAAALDHGQQIRPLVRDASQLAVTVAAAAADSRALIERLLGHFEQRAREGVCPPGSALADANELAKRSLRLVEAVESLAPGGADDAWNRTAALMDALMRRWVLYLIGVGAAWALFLWGGYYLVARRRARQSSPPGPPSG